MQAVFLRSNRVFARKSAPIRRVLPGMGAMRYAGDQPFFWNMPLRINSMGITRKAISRHTSQVVAVRA